MNILNHNQQNNQKQINNVGNSNLSLMEQIKQIKALVGSRNPKDVFYELCKQRGINPNDIINMLKS